LIGLGTIINTASIILGGIIGHFAGKLFREDQREPICQACGVAVIFVSIAGAMEGMLKSENGVIVSSRSMLVVLCIVLGTVIGELIGIEKGFERFGEWLKRKTGNSSDPKFANAFVTTSFTVCIGAMAIVGSIQDGVSGDFTMLAVKSVLDFIIVIVMTASMGKGCVFSAIPVFILEGLVTLLATLIAPLLTDLAISYLSLVGGIIVFGVGVNLVWGKKLRVANMLPGVLLALLAAYLPFFE